MKFTPAKIFFTIMMAFTLALPCGIACADSSANDHYLVADRKDRSHKNGNWHKKNERRKDFKRDSRYDGERGNYGKRDDRRGPGGDDFNSGHRPNDHFQGRPGQDKMYRPNGRPGQDGSNPPNFGHRNPGDHHIQGPDGMRPGKTGAPGNFFTPDMKPGNPPTPPQGMHPGTR